MTDSRKTGPCNEFGRAGKGPVGELLEELAQKDGGVAEFLTKLQSQRQGHSHESTRLRANLATFLRELRESKDEVREGHCTDADDWVRRVYDPHHRLCTDKIAGILNPENPDSGTERASGILDRIMRGYVETKHPHILKDPEHPAHNALYVQGSVESDAPVPNGTRSSAGRGGPSGNG